MDLHTDFVAVLNEKQIVDELVCELNGYTEDVIRSTVNSIANVHCRSLANTENNNYIKNQVKEIIGCKPFHNLIDSLSNLTL